MSSALNIARMLTEAAARRPTAPAIIAAAGGGRFRTVSFADLDQRSSALSAGFADSGIGRGVRTLVMVRAGIDLITVTFALFKAGAVPVLIDPGMGLRSFLHCVKRTRPDALVGVPLAHAVRLLFPDSFSTVRHHVTVGSRWCWGGPTLESLLARHAPGPTVDTRADDTAAVLFTSGSTGPAKGVTYTHAMFAAQVEALRNTYGFVPGEVDLAAFPLFSLFDCALEMTSVIPELDPSHPGRCDPSKVVQAIQQHGATTAFGSPAIWRRVAPWCTQNHVTLPRLKRVLIAGAPVPPSLVQTLQSLLPGDGDVQTPYGATESLPVSTITGREILATASQHGSGTCVGRPVAGMQVAVIGISDGPIPHWSKDLCVPHGEIGEICARGPVVTREYDGEPQATALAKIQDGTHVWHRMGDLGRVDAQGRLWFCGRKSERVRTETGTLFTDCEEGRYRQHPREPRVALVGVGQPGQQRPVLIVEGSKDSALARELMELGPVREILFHPRFPTDVRHNAKIHRLQLRQWAEEQLG